GGGRGGLGHLQIGGRAARWSNGGGHRSGVVGEVSVAGRGGSRGSIGDGAGSVGRDDDGNRRRRAAADGAKIGGDDAAGLGNRALARRSRYESHAGRQRVENGRACGGVGAQVGDSDRVSQRLTHHHRAGRGGLDNLQVCRGGADGAGRGGHGCRVVGGVGVAGGGGCRGGGGDGAGGV